MNSMPPLPNGHGPTLAGIRYAMPPQPSSGQNGAGSPYTMRGADVFGGPIEVSPQPNHQGLNGDMVTDPNVYVYPSSHVGYDFQHEPTPMPQGAGITPARLGPAPRLSQSYNIPGSSDSQVTPLSKNNPQHRPSTADGSSSDNSSSVERPARTEAEPVTSSDVEVDSPTKRVRSRIPTFEPPQPRATAPQKRKAVPAGRSSAKPAKAAVDPGVEGIPPGPAMETRPPLSFAWMIGNAILAANAGGLSLEHIYRYIWTCYPFFRNDDQWRNSVRHNLSIHKIFMTIPRSELHPPGKGGIWTIPDEEKCHWQMGPDGVPKFIKTFPPSDPHYPHCRQTKWDMRVEEKARAKAEADGVEYVPKKGKRGKVSKHRPGPAQGSTPIPFVLPPPPQEMMGGPPPPGHPPHLPPHLQQPMPMPMPMPPQPMVSQPHLAMSMHAPLQAPPIRGPPQMPVMPRGISPHPLGGQDRLQLEDDGLDFEPEEQDSGRPPKLMPLRFTANKERRAITPLPSMASSHGFAGQENRPPVPDEEGVFSTSGPSRPQPILRRSFQPTSPVDETTQVDMNDFFNNDDDNLFETPAHKRQEAASGPVSGSTHNVTSSAFKTPALTHTSSSPTSSPMPLTNPRGANHHPSGLQREWNPAEEVRTTGPHSPAGLDAPFAMKPTPLKKSFGEDDDNLHLSSRAAERIVPPKTPGVAPRTPGLPPKTMVGLPKTPITRSSAIMRTPNVKTPLNYQTPGRPNFTPSRDQLNTPLWEAMGCLDRLQQGNKTPLEPLEVLEQGNNTPRPTTNPASYSLDSPGRAPKDVPDIDSPISKRRRVVS
ncbi:hypothetical protein CspeluHIS016_0901560 [Cutaneotrichosporon spelunceum]|uniref:Fork-head domain-containing protein n=1 Tax=Cutaneotrichosporon spelunceum TaxID=1672016 RepID=A0AAD3TZV9_9TREE|nr:hypothetical protein CspeluHIS016_0901560 [Cutaneotrichosporon spelunceum]